MLALLIAVSLGFGVAVFGYVCACDKADDLAHENARLRRSLARAVRHPSARTPGGDA
jgi:hypothetical protein